MGSARGDPAAAVTAVLRGAGVPHRDPHALLLRNRSGTLVRFAESRTGDLHVHVDLPASCLDAAVLGRALSAPVQTAEVARTRLMDECVR